MSWRSLVGGTLVQSITAVKAGGHIAIIGFMDGFTSDLPLFPIVLKQAVLRGYAVGPRRAFEEMNQAFTKWKIRPVIDTVYPFADAPAAYDHLYRGPFGKVVIRIGD